VIGGIARHDPGRRCGVLLSIAGLIGGMFLVQLQLS